MRFGVFLPVAQNGFIISKAAPLYAPTFQHNLAIVQEAERQGFSFALLMMKWKGFGGETRFWDACMETFTLMAGIAAQTKSIELFPSTTLLTTHPAVCARMVSTIDDISEGRCGLNIVTGWNHLEYESMGIWPGADYYQDRYAYAEEYVQLLKRLWTEEEVVHQGRFFRTDGATILPQPKHTPTIVSAGQSEKGLRFVVDNADYSFVMAGKDKLAKFTSDMHTASAEAGRKVGTLPLYAIVSGRTDAEAQDKADRILAAADTSAIANIMGSAAHDTNAGGSATHLMEALSMPAAEGNMAYMSFPLLAGTPETIASKINDLAAETGMDGIMLSWPDFEDGVREFGEKIAPKIKY